MKKVLAFALCLVFAVAMITACSSPASQESSAAPSESESAAQSSEAPASSESAAESQAPAESSEQASAEATDDALQKVKDNGKLVMLTNATFPPYEYLGEGSVVAGSDVDIMQMIADEIGVELEVVDMDFDGLIPALQSGKGDIVAAGMTIDPERAESVDFSVPYTDATQLIIVDKADPKVSGPDDLDGKTIGVQLGTTGHTYIQWEIDDGADIEVVPYKSNMEAAMDLVNGRLDAIVLDELPAKSIAEANDTLAIIETPLTEEQYAMAVAKGNQSLLEVVNQVLNKLVDEGKVQEIIDQHVEAFASLNE